MSKQGVDQVLNAINKRLGREAIVRLTKDYVRSVETFSTGSLMLDLALGIGGFPIGRIIEIFGKEMSGKSTIAMNAVANFQKEMATKGIEKAAAWIDAEHALDFNLAASYGVDLENLIYMPPKFGEEAIDVAEALIRSGQFGLIVFDSVSALLPAKMAEASIEQQHVGLLARLMSVAMQKLTGLASANDCTVIFINQVREKIGSYGNPETTSGGRALPFYSSIRLNVRMGDPIKEGGEIVGHYVKCRVIKNKLAVPFKEAAFPLRYGVGVDRVEEIAGLAKLVGILEASGAWLKYTDHTGQVVVRDGIEYRWQGMNKLVDFLKSNPLFLDELENKIRGRNVSDAMKSDPVVDQDGYLAEEELEHAI